MNLKPMVWTGSSLKLLDQRELPHAEVWLDLTSYPEVIEAIRSMAVRGAPAIGMAGAYAVVLARQSGEDLSVAAPLIAAARPTAVNLAWAVDLVSKAEDPLKAAQEIEADDLKMNLAMGELGAALILQGARILTICNTGAFATAGYGTALGIIRTAHAQGKEIFVYSCETRPRMQGLKLTAFELQKEGIPFQSIADSVAGSLMQHGKVDLVIAGADRIAANGDTANKIGTYSLAVLAHHHQIPFVIAAPSSTLDPSLATGDQIPIEERDAAELAEINGIPVAPKGTPVYNPGFDVTPGELISHIVTEKAVFSPPYRF